MPSPIWTIWYGNATEAGGQDFHQFFRDCETFTVRNPQGGMFAENADANLLHNLDAVAGANWIIYWACKWKHKRVDMWLRSKNMTSMLIPGEKTKTPGWTKGSKFWTERHAHRGKILSCKGRPLGTRTKIVRWILRPLQARRCPRAVKGWSLKTGAVSTDPTIVVHPSIAID